MTTAARWIAAAAGVLVIGFLVWYFHTIVFYILISAVLAIIGKPVVNLLKRINIKGRYLPSWVAAMTTLLVMGAIIILLAEAFIPLIFSKAHSLSVAFDIQKISVVLNEPMAHVEEYINAIFPDARFSVATVIEKQLDPIIRAGFITESLGTVTIFIVNFTVAVFAVAFITFFFLKEDRLFTEGVVTLFPKRYEQNVNRAIDSATGLLNRYFVGICIESFIKLVCVSVALLFIGFEFDTAVIIGLVTAVLNLIPYIGPLLGGVIALLIAILSPVEGIAIGHLLFRVTMVLLIFQLLDNIVLQPYIYSSSVKAHPLEIFLVILMAGYIGGIVGMLFAIPAYTVLRVFAKEFFNNFRVVQRLTENI